MHHSDEDVVSLTTLNNEAEAAMIISALADRGIEATKDSSRAFPGTFEEVDVFVHEVDLPRAKHILEQLEEDRTKVDWSQVDVGQPEDPDPSLEDTL